MHKPTGDARPAGSIKLLNGLTIIGWLLLAYAAVYLYLGFQTVGAEESSFFGDSLQRFGTHMLLLGTAQIVVVVPLLIVHRRNKEKWRAGAAGMPALAIVWLLFAVAGLVHQIVVFSWGPLIVLSVYLFGIAIVLAAWLALTGSQVTSAAA